MRSIEGELEQLHGTLHKTNNQLLRTNQELRIIKWAIIAIVILLGLIAIKLGAFNFSQQSIKETQTLICEINRMNSEEILKIEQDSFNSYSNV